MLQFIVDGQQVDLPPDFKLSLIIENPLFLTDKIPVPYSTNFDLPPTPKNLKTFNYPNRINTRINFIQSYFVDIIFDGIQVLNGFLLLKEVAQKLNFSYRGVEITDNITKETNDIFLGNYQFGEGSRLTVDFEDPSNFAYNYKNLVSSTISGENAMVAAPIMLKDDDGKDAIPESLVVLVGRYAHPNRYLSFYNAIEKRFLFDAKVIFTTTVPFHSPTFLMPFLYHIINVVFGDSLISNPFADGELRKLVIPTTYHKNYNNNLFSDLRGILIDGSNKKLNVIIDNPFPIPNSVNLESFTPQIPVIDLIKEVFKLFCLSLYTVNNKFKIVYNKDIINNKKVENWTKKLMGKEIITQEAAKTYNYGYADYMSEQDLVIANINQLPKLSSLVPKPINDDKDVYYRIQNTDQVFCVKTKTQPKETVTKLSQYQVKKTGFETTNKKGNAFDATVKIAPMPTTIDDYYWLIDQASVINPNTQQSEIKPVSTAIRRWAVPQWDGNRLDMPEKFNIMIYHGLSEAFEPTDEYPLLSGFDTDHHGRKLSDLTLKWDGENGLLNRYHKEYKAFVEKEKIAIKGTFLLTALDIKNLDLTVRKNIKNRNFFIKKINVTISTDKVEPADAELIEDIDHLTPNYVAVRSQRFAKANCDSGLQGSNVPYLKVYTSSISQIAANNLADGDVNYMAEGQAYANQNGFCVNNGGLYISYTTFKQNIRNTMPYKGMLARPKWDVIMSIRLTKPVSQNVLVNIRVDYPQIRPTYKGSLNIAAHTVYLTATILAGNFFVDKLAYVADETSIFYITPFLSITSVTPNVIGGETIHL